MRLSFFILLLAAGCAKVEPLHTWNDVQDGNSLQIDSGKIVEGEEGDAIVKERYVSVKNTARTWVGSYAGEEEKVDVRKKLMLTLSVKEMERTCEASPIAFKSDPYFEMTERTPEAYGGGLLGVALANAFASYKNLPVSLYQKFKCAFDGKLKNSTVTKNENSK